MAKLSDAEKAEIIKRDMPGYKPVSESAGGSAKSIGADTSRLPSEAATPDIAALRRKYFGDDAGGDEAVSGNPGNDEPKAAKNASSADDDDEITAVEPEFKRDAWDRGARPKSVVISGSKKRIIGSQG